MIHKNRMRLAAIIALPLCTSGLYMSPSAFASEVRSGNLIVELEATGASVANSHPDKVVEMVEGEASEGETVQLVDVDGEAALVTVQYRPIGDLGGRAEPASSNQADDSGTTTAPAPSMTTIDGTIFSSGNFGGTVDRGERLEAAPDFASAITAESASFDWDTSGSPEYSVLRDGDEIGSSTDGKFTDSSLQPGLSYDYLLEGEADKLGNVASRSLTVRTLGENANRSDQVLQPLGYQPYTTAYDYKTFIPNDKVNNFAAQLGCGLGSDEFFKGDNRNFIGPGAGAPYRTPSYRTQMFLNVNWDNTAPYDLTYVKSVGPTRKLNSSGDVIETRTASDAGMVFQNPTRSGNLVTFGVSHEVGDPFCVAGAVRYSLTWVKIYRSGSVSIEGSRQPVPSHEAYARFSSSNGSESWKTLYQATGTNFNCLLPAICASENIKETVSG
ncbi:hypothetical protein [Rathayibacter rathayi]|uniref:hypothetical protein n=1 Tax=Rathayibacter rathayi TaxID=33887 RepID=UPI0011B05FB8|nr:hypothetical protein [Rathayibacter rathayi]